MFIKDVFTETPGMKGALWREAEKAGMKTPIDIDNWIFNKMILSNK
jgi:hypothetical protein